MRSVTRMHLRTLLGLCLLSVPLLPPIWMHQESLPGGASPTLAHERRPRTTAAAARREGWRYWRRAQLAVNEEREGLEAWDPAASGTQGQEVWRRQLMARGRDGYLRQARAAAQQAAEL